MAGGQGTPFTVGACRAHRRDEAGIIELQGWEHLPHDADIGIRGFGPTMASAFEQTALGMSAAVVDLDTVQPTHRVSVSCEAPAPDLLLVEWLNGLVYEMSVRGMVFARFQVTITGNHLTGEAWGEPVDAVRHQPAAEVKGATYTALEVSRRPQGWVAQCVVDV